jgi:hypothetical protein
MCMQRLSRTWNGKLCVCDGDTGDTDCVGVCDSVSGDRVWVLEAVCVLVWEGVRDLDGVWDGVWVLV